ncbi:relaxase/mobilization nuclease domain-containing protein [Pedobacter jeongneungensis]|uniref:relaxase/mobilization nuclease domain-containing protein n=1 Tax=Pedobacter jeongneungensis TaxID=947309 RepID=UPI000468EEB1|nr:relaxase/mobilization nuclease domain-containing protein [Pedobacter jeongneungensis]
MIAEISSGTNPVSMVLYNENKVTNGTATRIFSNNFSIENKEVFCATFKHLIAETSVEEPTRHISINLPPGEKVTDETFQNIAKDYMEKLGYGNQPYVVYRHADRPHEHIHIVTVNIDEDGRKINDFFEYKRSQKITRMLEDKYNLTQVSSEKNNKKSTTLISPEKQLEYKDLFEKKGVKIAIGRATQELKNHFKPTSLTDVKRLLMLSGIHTSTILNEDKSVKGLLFSMVDDPDHKPIHASDLYHSFSIPYLDNIFDKNQKFKESFDVSVINTKVMNVLDQSQTFNYSQFKTALNGRGIEPLFDKYKDGRVYGLSFLDLESGCVFKATEINRSLSFNKLKDRLVPGENVLPNTIVPKTLDKVITDVYVESLKEWKDLQNWASSQSLFLTSQDVSSILKFKLPLIDPVIIDEFISKKEKYFEVFESFNKLLKDNYKDVAHEMTANEIYEQVKDTPEFSSYAGLVTSDKVNQTIQFFIESRIQIEDEKRRRPIIENVIQSYIDHVQEKFPDDQVKYFVGKDSRERFILSLQKSELIQNISEKDRDIVIKQSAEKAIWVDDDKSLSSKVKKEILSQAKTIINDAYKDTAAAGNKLGDYYRLLSKGDEFSDKLSSLSSITLLQEKLKLLGKEELYDHHLEKVLVKIKEDLVAQAEVADRKDILKGELKCYYSDLNVGSEKLKLFQIIDEKSTVEGFVLHLESSGIFKSTTLIEKELLLKGAEEIVLWEKQNRVPPLKLSEFINEKVNEIVNQKITDEAGEGVKPYEVLRTFTQETLTNIFKADPLHNSINESAAVFGFKGDIDKLILDTLTYTGEKILERANRLERSEVINKSLSEYYAVLSTQNPETEKYLLIKDYSDHNEFFDFIRVSESLNKFSELERHVLLSEAIEKIQWDKENKVLPLCIENAIRVFVRNQIADGKVGGLSAEQVYRLMSNEGYLESTLTASGIKDQLSHFALNLGKENVFEEVFNALVEKYQASFPRKADEIVLSKYINEEIRDIYVSQFKQSGIKLESVYINNFLKKELLQTHLQQNTSVKEALATMAKLYPEFKADEFVDKMIERFIEFKFARLDAIRKHEEQQQRQTYADIISVFGSGNFDNRPNKAKTDKKKKKGRNI